MEDPHSRVHMAAFEHVRRLSALYDHLTAKGLCPDFFFKGKRMPFVNLQLGYANGRGKYVNLGKGVPG